MDPSRKKKGLYLKVCVRPVLLWGVGTNFNRSRGLLKYDFEDVMVIKLKYTLCVHTFDVLQRICFNVQTLLLKQILTRISVALVPEILMTQKSWVIHGHHDSLYYHFCSEMEENSPLDTPDRDTHLLGCKTQCSREGFHWKGREEIICNIPLMNCNI